MMFPSRVVSSTWHDESAKEQGDEQESLAGSRSIVFTIRLTEVHDKEVMVLPGSQRHLGELFSIWILADLLELHKGPFKKRMMLLSCEPRECKHLEEALIAEHVVNMCS